MNVGLIFYSLEFRTYKQCIKGESGRVVIRLIFRDVLPKVDDFIIM